MVWKTLDLYRADPRKLGERVCSIKAILDYSSSREYENNISTLLGTEVIPSVADHYSRSKEFGHWSSGSLGTGLAGERACKRRILAEEGMLSNEYLQIRCR